MVIGDVYVLLVFWSGDFSALSEQMNERILMPDT